MAQIERKVRRLPVRRRRRMLALDRRRFSSELLARQGWMGPAWAFGGLTILLYFADALFAAIADGPVVLGLKGALLLALAITTVAVVATRVADQRALESARDPKALRAALEEEMRVAGDRPAQTERIQVRARRAWVGYDDPSLLDVLVLDAGSDGVMCLRGPALHGVQLQGTTPPTVPATYALETLRWTQALISVSARSGAVPASRLSPAEVADLALSADCTVHRPEQLPPALAELTDARATDYR